MARARAARRGARREAQGGRRVRSRAAAAPVTTRRLREQPAQHVREDAAVPQVLALLRRVEAQSRADPEPYSLPAITISGNPSARYRSDASKIVISSPDGTCTVHVPSDPATSWLRSRTLANVPRTIT